MSSSMLFNVTTICYMVSMLIFFAFLASKNKSVGLAGSLLALELIPGALSGASGLLRATGRRPHKSQARAA